mgnify:CR=1 FL=1
MRIVLFISLFGLGFGNSFGRYLPKNVTNPPERVNILERMESSKWLNHTSKWLLKNHSLNLINKQEVEVLSTLNKNQLLTESEIGAAGVILYEFATGDGPSTRYFTNSDSFTISFMSSPGMYWVLNQYMSQYDSVAQFDSGMNMYNCRYQFSPLLVPFDLTTWDFSLNQHFATWEGRNISQIIVGSFNVDIQYMSDTTLQVHAWNKTSKKSLFLGLGNRWQRPLPLGTIDQHFIFELSMGDVRRLTTCP